MRIAVTDALSTSKAAIKEALRKDSSLDARLSQSGTLDSLGKRLYGWQKAFAFCTDPQPFQQLDEFVVSQVADYLMFVSRAIGGANSTMRMAVYGIPSTKAMFGAKSSRI